MRLLLDTHILLWIINDSPKLSAPARSLIKGAEAIHVSSVTLWEIAIKATLGKLQVDQRRLDDEIELIGAQLLPVTPTHARWIRDLPLLHADPFDRMLVAQSMSEPLHLLTHDTALRGYSELVVVV